MSRMLDSHADAQQRFEARVEAGTQPLITLAHTDGRFLICANVIYLAVTFMLYSIMQRRKVSRGGREAERTRGRCNSAATPTL